MQTNLIELTTPAEILQEEFMQPYGITSYRLAKDLGVGQMRVVNMLDRGNISPEMAVLLDAYFGMSPGYWSRFQADFDRRKVERRIAQDRIETIKNLGASIRAEGQANCVAPKKQKKDKKPRHAVA